MRRLRTLIPAALALLLAPSALAQNKVAEIAHIKGQGASVLQGLGLVMGLNGTGDSGKELVMARPLAEVLRRNGAPIPDIEELAKSRSVALVMVTCDIPPEGAKANDQLNAHVSVLHSASSLEGGRLYVAPLTAPFPGSPVWAFAQGSIVIENKELPTTGVVRNGAYIAKDIDTTPPIRTQFEIVLHPDFSGWRAASEVAGAINDEYLLTARTLTDRIAEVVDDRTIRVRVPEAERTSPAGFIGDVMNAPVSIQRLGLPAQVICNTRTGSIMVTGDVRISPAVISHKDLTITTTIPPPVPTPEDPIVKTERWADVTTDGPERELARIEDLIAALNQLAVPAQDQIEIFQMLHRAGKLQARLVIE
ncbi:MAG: flagellar basal body P-ring protein FlgI [Phycisphaerales bacterium]